MKPTHIKELIIKIFTNRDVQLTIALFGVGFILVVASTYPALETRVREDSLTAQNNTRIEVNLPFPYDKSAPEDSIVGRRDVVGGARGLKNASLVIESDHEETNATVTLLEDEEPKFEDIGIRKIKTFRVRDGETLNINMTEYYQTDYIDFNVTERKLNYTLTVNYYTQPYSFLSLPAYGMMIGSIVPFLRSFYTVGPIGVEEKEKEKTEKNQEKLEKILEEDR